jgi:hypothetical protein
MGIALFFPGNITWLLDGKSMPSPRPAVNEKRGLISASDTQRLMLCNVGS